MNDLIEYIFLINFISFFMYGIDKFLAIKHLTRIPEVVLFLLSFIGGSLGSLLGMKVFHHKTKKIKFYIINIFFLIIYLYILFRTHGV